MQKDSRLYLEEILEAVKRIEIYTKNCRYHTFTQNTLLSDAVIRNLEIIGEAVKKLSPELKKEYSLLEWKKIAGLRDILIHQYSHIHLKLIWDIIQEKIPHLKRIISEILEKKRRLK